MLSDGNLRRSRKEMVWTSREYGVREFAQRHNFAHNLYMPTHAQYRESICRARR
jgi:hypothetical protein